MAEIVKHIPTSLPTTREDLLAGKKVTQLPTLNDHVDDIHVALWPDEGYRNLLDAVYDEDAVEGSLTLDTALAAKMIRDHALANGNNYVANKKLHTIAKSLNVVLKRYGIGRKERRNTVHGEAVGQNGEE